MSDVERSWRASWPDKVILHIPAPQFVVFPLRQSHHRSDTRRVFHRNNKDARASFPGPRAEPRQAPNRPGRRQICIYIYDGSTSLRLLRDFSSHSTFHGKPSPRLDRLGVRWLSGSEPFTETHRRHCVTVSCRNNVKV